MPARPTRFDEFNGQRDAVFNLKIAVRSALRQERALSHALFTGPAGLGKTTLALSVLPAELGTDVRAVNCSSIEKPQELTTVLSTMKARSILFLDEIHALIPAAREHLLTVMEDRKLYVRIEEDRDVIEIGLPEFTVIGATTREGALDGPLRSRFGLSFTLQPYDDDAMAAIIKWHVSESKFLIPDEAIQLLLGAAHGVARRAVNLIEACIDSAYGRDDGNRAVAATPLLSPDIVAFTLTRLGFRGSFDAKEIKYLKVLDRARRYIGLKALAATLDETTATVEEVYEPWLLRQGYIERAAAGRAITQAGIDALAAAERKAS
jgi:Holliday junction DNA helicase RuvB